MVSRANITQSVGAQILEQSIPERFQTQVLRHGDRPAIVFQGRSLTYNELNRWSNQIARGILHRCPAEPEPIALLFETGPEMIAAMLGVLKTGKFYVPLDVSWPGSRLNSILEDSQAKLILSDRRQLHASDLDAADFEQVVSGRDVLWIDTLDGGISDENLEIQSYPDDLAYILYTSGSSGRPKGVMQNHRYVLNLYRNYTNSGAMTEEDRFSLLYSAAFGGAVRDIYCALLNGAALLPLDVKQIGLHQLGGWLQDNEITVMFTVATLFRHFAATLNGQGHFPKLRLLQIGSETVYRQDAELFGQNFSEQCTLMVNLGGTEISPVRQFPVKKHAVLSGSTVPAGYGVEGTEVLLWDEGGQEVPPGEVGEIVVQSRQVALGYWRQPELTEQVFVRDGDRRYFKTGDLGRLLPDGCLLHLGRKDFQVKIRGYRVETSEVEAALLNLESVGEAVVVARAPEGGAVGDLRLVAYLTPVNSQNMPTAKELKVALEAKLPGYMVPACFIWLESLPLTATGKVDRRGLPKPESVLWTSELDVVPPRTATEETLVKIWSEVLKFKPIGIENNFFELGGNSLHASQVLARISERFCIELPLKLIFEATTIRELSEYLESVQASASSPPQPPTPTQRGAEIPLSLTQQRLWFLDRLEANKAVYNLFRGFRLTGEIDVGCLERAIQTIISRHEILRTTFQVIDGSPVQAIAEDLPFALSVANLRDLPAAERASKVEQIIAEVRGWTFDLTQSPLLKAVLIHLDTREHCFLVTMHHIISDDWSMQVFLKELSVLYRAFRQGHPSPLPPLPIQYADYAHWQRQWLAEEVLDNQLNYWRQQLADAPGLLDLPTDFPRTSEQGFQAGVVPIELDRGVSQRLKALSQRSGTTLFITLLTAFATLLSRYSNQEDVIVGTAMANRKPLVTEQLIGFFVSTLPLRIRLGGNPTFKDLLDEVRQTALDAYAHGDVPFDRLVESLQIERHLSHTPLFQVMFLLQNAAQETLALPELEAEPLNFAQQIAGATFDLTLSLKETAAGGIQGIFQYNAKRFEGTAIACMARHFQTLLEGIVANPEQKIAQLPLLTVAERHQLLVAWNNTQTDYPSDKCIHQLFEDQVEKTPDAVAVVFSGKQLTYGQLNEKANRVAYYLLEKGVKPEVLVGICVERSLEMVIGLLGILKAGGAYVPLDPTYPAERLAYMLEDATVPVLLTTESLLESLPEHSSEIVCLDRDWHLIAQQSQENSVSGVRAENLAYVIYTSGSTGKPKGVLIDHQGLLNLVFWHLQTFELTSSERISSLAGVAFDALGWEIWPCLSAGASLHLINSEARLSPEKLRDWLVEQKITLAFVPTPMLESLSAWEWPSNHVLRLLLTGGDQLHLHICESLPWPIINNYGPTENTVVTTSGLVVPPPQGQVAPSIGRPIA
ncbi:MAG: amino acid adenylation domain-containing protein, partial [Xenococcaceae cyanobacterium]